MAVSNDSEFCRACYEFCSVHPVTPPTDDWSAGFAFAAWAFAVAANWIDTRLVQFN